MMSKKQKIILSMVCLLLIIVSSWLFFDYHNSKYEVIFFDVGQGDSILINLPGNNEILVDGGPDNTVLYKLGKYMPIYDRSIELMILTHPHADHVTGLVEVLKRYNVKQVMFTDVDYDSGIYDEFIKLLNDEEITKVELKDINLDEQNILRLIYPLASLAGQEFENLNDSSIVFKLDTPYQDFLFTGDMEIGIEQKICDTNFDLSADVLKVGHHGSDTSSEQEFLEQVKPQQAIISVGEGNKFDHPSLRTIKRLERSGAEVFRTDKDGDVKIKIK